jgi:aryl-alcohol dehydrogenase-like predicted oxidoreductase
MTELRQVALGASQQRISAIGFGAMHLANGERCTPENATSVLHRALELGVTLIDTADRYCRDETDAHINEKQIAAALATYAGDISRVCVATKGGMLRPGGMWVRFGKPDHIRRTIRESFEALGGDRPIPLWQYHQPDHNYPLEETLGAVKEAVDAGLIRHVGVSNFTVPQIERARRIVDIVSVQNEYSLWCREVERNGLLEYCEREGLTLLAWRPLGGTDRAKKLGENQSLNEIAHRRGVSAHELAIAWLLAKSSRVVPIPGSTRVAGVEQSVAASAIALHEHELRALESAIDEEPPSLRLIEP